MILQRKTTIEVCKGLESSTGQPIVGERVIQTDPPVWASERSDGVDLHEHERFVSQWMDAMHSFSVEREKAISRINRRGGTDPGEYDVEFVDEQAADALGSVSDPFVEMEILERYATWFGDIATASKPKVTVQ